MAYQMTGLTKGLLALTALGAIGSAAWHFVVKDKVQGASGTAVATAPGKDAPVAAPTRDGALGTAGNPLRISLVSFHGYAPAVVANGNSLKTAAGSIYERLGIHVEFAINDDIPTIPTLFEAKSAQCVWRTSDFWAQEHPNVRNAGHDGKAILIVDNTQGGDAVIARDPAIKTIEDLAGKNVGLVQFTPSHGMLIDAIENSSMTARAKQQVRSVFIKPEEGTAGVRAAFVSGDVDAAVLWDPDLSLALRDVKGAHVVYSTKTATNLIYDVIVCDQRELAKPENEAVFQKFVDGWLEGVKVSRANPDQAVDGLINSMEFFKVLAGKEGKPFVKGLFGNVVWTDLSDNARVLGMAGGVNHYERVYTRFDQIYRGAGALANPNSPVIPAQDSFDTRFIKAALARDTAAKTEAAKPQAQFTDQGRADAMTSPAAVTKPVAVNFSSGSSELSKRAQRVIDTEMIPFIENNGSAYFELSGNTDGVGSAATNQGLSVSRAKAVAEYLEKQWEIPKARLRVTGFGSSRPLCDEANPAAAGMSMDECRALNRSTRLAVFGQ
jgi:NitT/TauT family transport system substrate-binding protein